MQSPINLPDWNINTFAPINADLNPIMHFGDIQSASLDTSQDFVQVLYQDINGFLSLNGTFTNGTNL
jgi:hypothetical protein